MLPDQMFSISRFGPQALRIRFTHELGEEALARCRGLTNALRLLQLESLVDMTSGYGEILLEFSDHRSTDDALPVIEGMLPSVRPLPAAEACLHRIPVTYDGPDLAPLAKARGLSVADVVEIHSSSVYSVYVIGFSPGFPYLGPLDSRLHTPRLSSPRLRVEAGSVAIGGAHTGIYSIASAGGWHLIGRTSVELFSLSRASGSGSPDAFLLQPGDRVQFLPAP